MDLLQKLGSILSPSIKKKGLIDKTGNQINTIYPYRKGNGWVFDDEEVGLYAEPFVLNMPQIIDFIVGNQTNTFTCHISKDLIPNADAVLTHTSDQGWYILDDTQKKGWLCPATLKYFKTYPDKIYVKIDL